MKIFEYYYDLEEVCGNRVAYRPKATSAGITSTGYAPNVAVASSNLNGDNEDGEKAIDDNVPEDIWANLDAVGLCNTTTDRSRLTSNTSTTAAKKAQKNSKKSSNKKGRKASTSLSAINSPFDSAATQYTSRHYIGSAQTSVAEEPTSETVVAAEDAAAL